MKCLKRIYQEETGGTLVEILASIIILGLTLLSMAVLMNQNYSSIQINQLKEASLFAQEDIKEWLTYRATNQDIANLNQFTLVKEHQMNPSLTEAEKRRRNHFILDESGIQKTVYGENIYGEIPQDKTVDRGESFVKVLYDFSGDHLPEPLKSDDYNKYYIGEYVDNSKQDAKLLVEVVVRQKNLDEYEPRKDGVELNIKIYSKKTGQLLSEGFLNWIAEY